jgi:hypothetical protein
MGCLRVYVTFSAAQQMGAMDVYINVWSLTSALKLFGMYRWAGRMCIRKNCVICSLWLVAAEWCVLVSKCIRCINHCFRFIYWWHPPQLYVASEAIRQMLHCIQCKLIAIPLNSHIRYSLSNSIQ